MIEKMVLDFLRNSPKSFITENEAINSFVIGLRLFDPPIVEYADASDPMFESFRSDPSITK